MSIKSVIGWFARFACITALVGTACAKNSSPTSPTTTTPPPNLPANTATVTITVNPNPVPFNGAPITDAPNCAGYAFTWFYDQVFQEYGGTDVTFRARLDTFDDKTANNITGLNITIPAHGSLILHTRWCSGAAIAHAAQSTFIGTDAKGTDVAVIGPVARLMPPGK